MAALLLSGSRSHAAIEQSVFVYDAFSAQRSCSDIQQYLADLTLRRTVLLSLEQGHEFLLDSADGRARVACALTWLKHHGHKTKALLLQDTKFLLEQEEGVRRIQAIQQYGKQSGGFSGVLVDVEPHADPQWECGDLDTKRKLADQFVQLLTRSRSAAHPMSFEVLVPSWYPALQDVPQLQPERLAAFADGFYVMIYGDEGGPLVGGSVSRVIGRFPLSAGFLKWTRSYLALATYEAHSAADMQRDSEELQHFYKHERNFAGVALFHATSKYAVPLVKVISGTVINSKGEAVPGAVVQLGRATAQTNQCGEFSLRGRNLTSGKLQVIKPGASPLTIDVRVRPAGETTELGSIRWNTP